MSAKIPVLELVAFMDANAGRYKNAPEPDGYNATQAICSELVRRPLIDNPVGEAPQIPKPMDAAALWTALSDDEKADIGIEGCEAIKSAITMGDRDEVKRYANIAWKKTWITQQKHDAIVAEVDATIDDPTWTAQIRDTCDLRKQWPTLEPGLHRSYIHQIMGRE